VAKVRDGLEDLLDAQRAGSGISCKPDAVCIFVLGRMADGATGCRPCGVFAGCAMRPTYMSSM
jgi:hypothetical protein